MARSPQGDPRLLVEETASAFRGLRLDPGGLVLGCRRIVERHPFCGPLWWLAAHLVTSADPFERSRELADWIVEDPTASRLAREMPEDATVVVIGWPDLIADALVRRGDLRVRVVDSLGEGAPLVRRLERGDLEVDLLDAVGVAPAIADADLVLVEPLASGPESLMARIGSGAAAMAAAHLGVEVWGVLGRGRRLPEGLFQAMSQRIVDTDEPWEEPVETLSWSLVDRVVHAEGSSEPDGLDRSGECPMAAELLRSSPI